MNLMTFVVTDALAANDPQDKPTIDNCRHGAAARAVPAGRTISLNVLDAEEMAHKKIDDIGDIGNEVHRLSFYSFVPGQVNPSMRIDNGVRGRLPDATGKPSMLLGSRL